MLPRFMTSLAFVTAFPVVAFSQGSAKADRFALLVGIDDFDHADLKKLQYAENDMLELQTVLRNAGYQVELLAGKAATKKRFEAELRAVTDRFPKNGTLIVALAGH